MHQSISAVPTPPSLTDALQYIAWKYGCVRLPDWALYTETESVTNYSKIQLKVPLKLNSCIFYVTVEF